MYVCVCNAVRADEVRKALLAGHSSVRELRVSLGYSSSCGRCTTCLQRMLDEHARPAPADYDTLSHSRQ